MKENTKNWLLFFLVVFVSMVLTMIVTGRGELLKYYLRKSPEKAMEEYLEEKYDDEVTCLEWGSDYGLNAFWTRGQFGGTFESKNFPGVTFSCSASLKKGGWSYEFADSYLLYVYREGFQELIEKIAAKHFEGEYYVVVEPVGKGLDETVEIISFDDFVKRYLQYRVSILTEEMSDVDAIHTMQEFVSDAQGWGFQCDFNLGRANKNVVTLEELYSQLWEQGDEFDLWRGNDIEWLYMYSLQLTEGKSKPEIYILTEEEK